LTKWCNSIAMKTIVIALMLVLGAGSGVMSQNAKLKKTKAYFEEVREVDGNEVYVFLDYDTDDELIFHLISEEAEESYDLASGDFNSALFEVTYEMVDGKRKIVSLAEVDEFEED
jgi:hypothetical protein